ncbi:MAG: phosphoenolpyruvate carboxykinase (ATP) [Candidatus Riflebacteria bacterium]|nr:phosphoenolpyruvate carboxykinase (ATP) [Candidatus Riflebacteria bacterium]
MSTNVLDYIGIKTNKNVYVNLPAAQLVEEALLRKEGKLASNGALLIAGNNGNRFGRSPNDRFVVETNNTDGVWWGDVNKPFPKESWDRLFTKAKNYLADKDIFVFDGFAGADESNSLQVRVIAEKAWHALFATTLFIDTKSNLLKETPGFTVINVCDMPMPDFKDYGLNSEVFVLLNFEAKTILICGTHYGGEIKKGIFSVMNYLLPAKGTLTMHCSANVSHDDKSALFFGLSGTGKTTLSADPNRRLIGDDEHGWNDKGIFNFEGGCYAKCIKLSKENEPQIYNAIRFGSVLENVVVDKNRVPDYDDGSITENSRVTYPTSYIDNCIQEGTGGHPTDIFFLTADAFGVLPPISKLTPAQAMYHFLSGYTAKLAGTEAGVTEPQATFSTCFGAPFMVRHPSVYAQMLAERMKKHNTHIWLVNTGWNGTGKRISIKHTRALLTAALNGDLEKVKYNPDPIFKILVPESCPEVPTEILNPINTWTDKAKFAEVANDLAKRFNKNFEKYASETSEEVRAQAPVVKEAKAAAAGN